MSRRARPDRECLRDSDADFFGKPRSDTVPEQRGKRREPKGLSMPFVSRLSVLTAYVVFAFVGAIVLGVF
jgi:hypothetical protein